MAVETSIVREAPFLEAQRSKLLESASKLAGTPVTLPRQQLAGLSDTTQQAFNLGTSGIGAFEPYLNTATGIAGDLAQRGTGGLEEARQFTLAGAGDITGRISDFQNPYQQQVIDAFNAEATRQSDMARQRADDQAIRAGAFGGSGSAIGRAELERNLADITQRNTANLLSTGFNQALGAAEREANRFAAASPQLQSIEQLQYSLPAGVAQLQTGLGSLAQSLPAQDVALLSQIGAQQQQQAQRALDVDRQNILSQTYEPYQRVGFMSDILKGTPSTTSTLTQSSDPRTNPLSQALGAGISLAGIFGPSGFGSGYLFKNPGAAGGILGSLRG